MLPHYILVLSLTCVALMAVALFVFIKGRPHPPAQIFVMLTASVVLWSGVECAALLAQDRTVALWLWRLSHVGVIAIPALFVYFVAVSLDLHGTFRQLSRWCFWIQGVFLLCNVTPWLVHSVQPKLSFRYYMEPGPLYIVFVMWWVVLAVVGLWQLYQASTEATGLRQKQLQYVCWGAAFAFLGGFPNFLPAFEIELIPLNPYGTLSVPLCAMVVAYALVHHRLVGMPLALMRGALMGAIYAVVLGVPLMAAVVFRLIFEQWLGGNWWLVPLLMGIILAIAGTILFLHVQQEAEHILLREERQYQFALLRTSLGMTRVRSVKRLQRLIAGVVTRIAHLHAAALFVKNRRLDQYELVAARHFQALTPGSRIPHEAYVVHWLKEHQAPMVIDELRFGALGPQGARRVAEQLAFQLERAGIAMIVPSFLERELVGFLAVGPKRSGDLYSSADLKMFNVLATQCALAMENATSFEDLQQTQAQLFQAQQIGTLSQMAAGMSHQIHNRLNVLSLAAQSARITVLPRLERFFKSLAQVPDEASTALGELYHFYDIIEQETERGAQIVRALSMYSKPSAGSELFLLNEIVNRAIEMLGYKHDELQSVQMHQEHPPMLPHLKGNRTQLQDVLFNLLDNACDAIRDKRREFERAYGDKHDGYRGEIRIRSAAVQSPHAMLQVTISDNGAGMTREEQDQMFVPYFTTKPTALKGSGLSLFIIRKIVESQGGTIRGFSQLGKGSVFILELPIATAGDGTP